MAGIIAGLALPVKFRDNALEACSSPCGNVGPHDAPPRAVPPFMRRLAGAPPYLVGAPLDAPKMWGCAHRGEEFSISVVAACDACRRGNA